MSANNCLEPLSIIKSSFVIKWQKTLYVLMWRDRQGEATSLWEDAVD